MAKETESVQFVLFSAQTLTEDAAALWQKVFGTPIHTQGAPPNAPSFAQSSNKGDLVRIQVTTVPGYQASANGLGSQSFASRIDMVFSGTPIQTPTGPPASPRLADPVQAMQDGLAAAKKLARQGLGERVAIVVTRFEVAASLSNASTMIAASIPNLPLPKNPSDLLYQISSTRPSTRVLSHSILRYCRWTAASYAFFMLGVGIQGVPSMPSQFAQASAVEYIDVSTMPTEPVAAADADALIDDIYSDVQGIMSKGYSHL